jgi:uncharacterized MnhB-related membrane protein
MGNETKYSILSFLGYLIGTLLIIISIILVFNMNTVEYAIESAMLGVVILFIGYYYHHKRLDCLKRNDKFSYKR